MILHLSSSMIIFSRLMMLMCLNLIFHLSLFLIGVHISPVPAEQRQAPVSEHVQQSDDAIDSCASGG